jgi:type I restriction enzyme R subunit
MTKQTEYLLEDNLVEQLSDLGYKKVVIKDERDLIDNLQSQLQK